MISFFCIIHSSLVFPYSCFSHFSSITHLNIAW
jgi:hypothetical protein